MGTPKTDRIGCAGHGRHGGEASALCVGSDDVGLELLVLFFQEKRTNINMPQPQMPAIAQAGAGMIWQLAYPLPHTEYILPT